MKLKRNNKNKNLNHELNFQKKDNRNIIKNY